MPSPILGTRSIHTTNRPCDASTIAPSTRAVFSPSIRAKKKHPTQSNIVQITPIPPPSKLLALDLSSSTNTNSPTNAAVSSGIPATAVSSSLSNVLSPGYPLGGSLEGAKPLSSSEAANVAGPSSVGHPMTASARNVTFPNDLASIHTAFSFGEKSISIWSNEAAEK